MPTAPIYCPVCREKLVVREQGGRQRPVCTACGYVHYVNPVPTVGVLIEKDGGVVLIRRGHEPHKGKWTFPSGYVEIDERLEEAAVREAEEETGLKVEIIELADVNSYPEGPPSSGIMVFYRARPVGGEMRAGDDASEVRVFQPDEVPPLPFRTHREMFAHWMAAQGHTALAPHHQLIQPAYTVRQAEARDAHEIIELVRMIPANHHLSDADWHDSLLRLREATGLEVYVASLATGSQIVIGCLLMSIVRTLTAGYGFINDMAVLPTYRRQGVGAALLETAMRRAAALNLQTLTVNLHRADDSARAFYRSAGFSDTALLHLHLR